MLRLIRSLKSDQEQERNKNKIRKQNLKYISSKIYIYSDRTYCTNWYIELQGASIWKIEKE